MRLGYLVIADDSLLQAVDKSTCVHSFTHCRLCASHQPLLFIKYAVTIAGDLFSPSCSVQEHICYLLRIARIEDIRNPKNLEDVASICVIVSAKVEEILYDLIR